MNRLGPLLLLGTLVLLVACHRRHYRPSDDDASDILRAYAESERDIVFISATFRHDTLRHTYSMEAVHAERLPGRLKSKEPEATASTGGFTYVKRGASGEVISTHRMDNPLVVDMETTGEGGALQRTRTERDSAQVFLRISYVEGLSSVVFRRDDVPLVEVPVPR